MKKIKVFTLIFSFLFSIQGSILGEKLEWISSEAKATEHVDSSSNGHVGSSETWQTETHNNNSRDALDEYFGGLSLWRYWQLSIYMKWMYARHIALIWQAPSAIMATVVANIYIQRVIEAHNKILSAQTYFLSPYLTGNQVSRTTQDEVLYLRDNFCLSNEYIKILYDKEKNAEHAYFGVMVAAAVVAGLEIPGSFFGLHYLVQDSNPLRHKEQDLFRPFQPFDGKERLGHPVPLFYAYFSNVFKVFMNLSEGQYMKADIEAMKELWAGNSLGEKLLKEFTFMNEAQAQTTAVNCEDESTLDTYKVNDLDQVHSTDVPKFCPNISYSSISNDSDRPAVVQTPRPSTSTSSAAGTERIYNEFTDYNTSNNPRPDVTLYYTSKYLDPYSAAADLDGLPREIAPALGIEVMAKSSSSYNNSVLKDFVDDMRACYGWCWSTVVSPISRLVTFSMLADTADRLRDKTKASMKKINCRMQYYSSQITTLRQTQPPPPPPRSGSPNTSQPENQLATSDVQTVTDPTLANQRSTSQCNGAPCPPPSKVFNEQNQFGEFDIGSNSSDLTGVVTMADGMFHGNDATYRTGLDAVIRNNAANVKKLNDLVKELANKPIENSKTGEKTTFADTLKEFKLRMKKDLPRSAKSFENNFMKGFGGFGELKDDKKDLAANKPAKSDLAVPDFSIPDDSNPFEAKSKFQLENLSNAPQEEEDPDAGNLSAKLQGFEVESNDITKAPGESIFKLVSVRYLKSFYTYLAKVQQKKKLESPKDQAAGKR